MSAPTQNDNPNLNNKRQRISEIDAGILALLDERTKLAMEIANIKKQIGKDIEDLERETTLLSELVELNRTTVMNDNHVKAIWMEILKASKETQEEVSNGEG